MLFLFFFLKVPGYPLCFCFYNGGIQDTPAERIKEVLKKWALNFMTDEPKKFFRTP